MILHDEAQAKKIQMRLAALITDPSATSASDVVRAVDRAPDHYRRQAIETLENYVQTCDGKPAYHVVDALITLRRT